MGDGGSRHVRIDQNRATPIPPAPALADRYRAVMRGKPAAVALAVFGTPDGDLGQTVTSFVSLGLDPPTAALSIRAGSHLGRRLRRDAPLTVAFLDAGQEKLAASFAGGRIDVAAYDWSATAWDHGANGVRHPRTCLGWMEGEARELVPVAGNTLVIFTVTAASAGTGEPLLYRHGRYDTLRPLLRTG